MGQRYVQLESTYTGYSNTTAILHVSQVPPNPAILAPGPAFIFVVVNGVPSIGAQVMIGSGKLGAQPILSIGDLPSSSLGQGAGNSESSQGGTNTASRSSHPWINTRAWGVLIALFAIGW